MKLLLPIAALPLLLGGCLPLPVTIASAAISGISYMTTGKSSTDHVISAATDQDCALTRPIIGEAVCRESEPGDYDASDRVIVAAYPGDRDDGAFQSTRDARIRQGSMKLDELPKGPAQIAVAFPFAGVVEKPVSTPGLVATAEVVVPVPEARPVLISAPATSWAAPKPIARLDIRTTGSGKPVQASADQSVETTGETAGSLYVVLGSLRDRGRASVLADRFASLSPEVRQVDVDGTVWNRVVVGPFDSTSARGVKAELGTIEGKTPWIISMAPRVEQVAMR